MCTSLLESNMEEQEKTKAISIPFLPIAFLINTMRRKCSGYTYGPKCLINLYT